VTPQDIVDEYSGDDWARGRIPMSRFPLLVEAIATEHDLDLKSKKKYKEAYEIAAAMVRERIGKK
jgi:hypothetical protein